MEIAIGMTGIGFTFLGVILVYIWRVNRYYIRELQQGLQRIAEGQQRIAEGQERIARELQGGKKK